MPTGTRGAGSNGVGRLGDGTTTTRRVPVPVVGMLAAVTASAGALHSPATTTSGALFAWGRNVNAAMGDGTTTSRLPPAVISMPNAVDELAASGVQAVPKRDVYVMLTSLF